MHVFDLQLTVALNYLDLYLKNVLLLADVFEEFWNMFLECYGLDPCHYLSRSGLSWDTMLKIASIKSDPLTDVDMEQFIVKSIWSGVLCITKV